MATPEFPPNSDASKRSGSEKKIDPVVTSGATRKRRSLRRQFRELFVAGDARGTVQYVVLDVLLPAAKDMIVEAGAQGIEKLIFGDARRRGSTPPQSGPMGRVNYNRVSMVNRLTSPERVMSRQARARHNFDEIILSQRSEAEEVIDRLFDLVSRYASASVADLYELVGLDSSHTDNKWGWTDLSGSNVSRVRDGYLLDLPEPQPFG